MDIKQILSMPNRGAIEEWAKTGARSQYIGTVGTVEGQTPIALCRVLNKYLMWVPAQDCSVAPHLMMSGMWEPWITMAIAEHIRPGMRCIDVGAHVGYYTVLMADLVGEKGRVLAVEPQDHLVHCLDVSLSMNGIRDRVHIEPVAVSNAVNPQNARLHTHPNLTGDASLLERSHLGLSDEVEVSTLDTLIAEWECERPDFVKIDAEGMEYAVLMGLTETLRKGGPITLCVEVTGSTVAIREKFGDQFEIGTVGFDGHVRKFDPSRDERDAGDWQMLWLERR